MRILNFIFNIMTLFPVRPEIGMKNHIIISEQKNKINVNQLNKFNIKVSFNVWNSWNYNN